MTLHASHAIAALAAGLAFTASPALADPADIDTVVMEFAYTPTDFSTYEGAEAVYAKLKREAFRSCSDRGSAIPTPVLNKMHSECISSLVSAAIQHINAPELRAMHDTQVKLASR